MSGSLRAVLYTGSLCPLCDKARDLVDPLLPPGVVLEEINIETDPQLRAAYGDQIPVVALIRGEEVVAEKAWPFSPAQVRRLLGQTG